MNYTVFNILEYRYFKEIILIESQHLKRRHPPQNTQRPEFNKGVFILIIFRKSSDGQPHIGFSSDKVLAHHGVDAGCDGHCHVVTNITRII